MVLLSSRLSIIILCWQSSLDLSFMADDSTQDSNTSSNTMLQFNQSASDMESLALSISSHPSMPSVPSVESMEAFNQSSSDNDKASGALLLS